MKKKTKQSKQKQMLSSSKEAPKEVCVKDDFFKLLTEISDENYDVTFADVRCKVVIYLLDVKISIRQGDFGMRYTLTDESYGFSLDTNDLEKIENIPLSDKDGYLHEFKLFFKNNEKPCVFAISKGYVDECFIRYIKRHKLI